MAGRNVSLARDFPRKKLLTAASTMGGKNLGRQPDLRHTLASIKKYLPLPKIFWNEKFPWNSTCYKVERIFRE